ncbi:hypothetical protein J2848_004356 [Azospirillum lipoferum]|uniref:hypothetical protein n=1 Tax=Azospirillum TaxID=191 RepID=UPI00147823FD|nr:MULTISPECIES: hypothetical protein [Azospirillum]MCP1612664.1 hypothetical protein [Azospirillum lipoferum]MDW5532195.1 hypothetical protein [Azospirillum sp. NL1]
MIDTTPATVAIASTQERNTARIFIRRSSRQTIYDDFQIQRRISTDDDDEAEILLSCKRIIMERNPTKSISGHAPPSPAAKGEGGARIN